MPNQLPLPDDFQHLIEKRSGIERRSSEAQPVDNDRRAGTERRGENLTEANAYCPGDRPGKAGNYRCENCLAMTMLKDDRKALPNCSTCGNTTQKWFIRLA